MRLVTKVTEKESAGSKGWEVVDGLAQDSVFTPQVYGLYAAWIRM